MNAAQVRKSSLIWFRTSDHRIIPLNASLQRSAATLQDALAQGVSLQSDPLRRDFYEVSFDNGWAYIHLREDLRTIYLVAFAKSRPANPEPVETCACF